MRSIISAGVFLLLMNALSSLAGTQDTLTIKGLFYDDLQPVSVQVADGKIVGIKHLPTTENIPDVYISPGLIDVQINGYLGIDFSGVGLTVKDVSKAVKALWKEGITTFFPTLISRPDDLLKQNFRVLARAKDDPEVGMSIPGFHMEGPYISPVQGYSGSHPREYIRKPEWEEFKAYQEAAGYAIKLITVAPEVEDGIPFISKCVEDGVVVSLGHHNGSAEVIQQAVDAGAFMSTHLGNGCANQINRHHNPIWPQLADTRLTLSIIVDGFHLTKEEVISFYKVKGPECTILVSDMVNLAGLPPGEYKRGNQTFLLTPYVVKYPAEDVLEGAASSLRRCMGNMMRFTGCSLKDAIRMASTNPARIFKLDDLGEIKVGKKADLIIFRIEKGEIQILRTMVAGKIVYSNT